jgi:hypothetical protein
MNEKAPNKEKRCGAFLRYDLLYFFPLIAGNKKKKTAR